MADGIADGIGKRLVYKERISTMRNTLSVLRQRSVAEAFRHQVDGFGHNNRDLVMG